MIAFVIQVKPLDNGVDVTRTVRKLAEVLRELREDGVQLTGASIHAGDDAVRLNDFVAAQVSR